MQISVIIPAAGSGKRFNRSKTGSIDLETNAPTKIELPLAGKPVFMRVVELFVNRPEVNQIVLAVHPDKIDDFRLRWGDSLSFHNVLVVPGGTIERWETISKALKVIDRSSTHVAIHDAARPLTTRALIDRVFDTAKNYSAVIPGLPIRSTVKRVAEVTDGSDDESLPPDPLAGILDSDTRTDLATRRVIETVDRRDLVEAQTPQVFDKRLLERAYDRLPRLNTHAITDDAGLVELLGETVHVVAGEPINWKITESEDLRLAEAVLTTFERAEALDVGRKRLFAHDDD